MLTRSRHDLPDDAAQADQIAHGFMIGVRNPDGHQLSSPMKTGEYGRIATICLHPIARLRRNQRRRHHIAPMAKACELTMNAIAARAGLITKRQRLVRTPKTVAQLADRAWFIDYLAKVFHRPRSPALRHRDRKPRLSWPLRPGSPGLPGSRGATRSHCASLKIRRVKARLLFEP